jgi:AraC-like DNA-binding protein
VQVVTLRTDSPRGRWTYREWQPPELAHVVDRFWHSEGTTTEDFDRHYPHAMIELLLNLGADDYRLVEPAGATRFSTTWLCGQMLGPVVTRQPSRHGVLGIRLRPAGAYALLGTPLREVTGLVVELEDVVGPPARELVSRCREAASVEACFRLVAAWVAARVDGAPRGDPAITWAAAQIEAAGGEVSIGRLRAETGLSKTKLAAAFRDQIGVAPKLYARLVRFRRALALVERGPDSLADVALATGYYDQPHFNADFRELTGLSPRQLLVARYPSGVPIMPPED